jgi:hypothetical protein
VVVVAEISLLHQEAEPVRLEDRLLQVPRRGVLQRKEAVVFGFAVPR